MYATTVAVPGRDHRTVSPPEAPPLPLKGAPRGADPIPVSVSPTSAAGAVQIALLAKVLQAARPDPAASGPQAVTQAASSQALLATVGTLDVYA